MTISQDLIKAAVTSTRRDFKHHKNRRFSMEEILDKALVQQVNCNGDFLDYWLSLTDLSRKQLRIRIMMQYYE